MKRCFGIFILMFVISGQASALVETSTLRDFIKRKEAGKLTKYEQICVEDGYGCMPFPDLKNIELFKKITYYPNADVYCQDGSSSFYVPKKFFSTKETKKARAFCKAFSSNNIHDNKSKTAWCEGVEGNGVGEVLIVGRLPTGTTGGERLKVWNGYGKSEKVFESNNRIKDLTLIIYLTMDHSNGDAWTNLYPIKMKKFKLKD
ncbi:MAG: hypothetical protein KDD58_12775, partial [Bdellovibrionales bacterium]|nr:hypothetical protein [Bdellovibrionales bacterium]